VIKLFVAQPRVPPNRPLMPPPARSAVGVT
jgi:hypothetical protein